MATTTSADATAAPPIQIGQVVSATFAALRQNLATHLVFAAIFSGLPSVLVGSLLTRSASTGQLDAFRLSYLQSGIEGAFPYPLIAAVILRVAADRRGEKLSFGDCWRQGMPAWGALFGLGFVKWLGIGLGLLLLIVPGLIWAVMWSVALPVKVIENRPLAACLARSSALTKGRRWPVAGLLPLYAVGIVASGVLLGLVAGLLMAALRAMALPLMGPVQLATFAIVSMANDLVGAACLFFELRTTKESDTPDAWRRYSPSAARPTAKSALCCRSGRPPFVSLPANDAEPREEISRCNICF